MGILIWKCGYFKNVGIFLCGYTHLSFRKWVWIILRLIRPYFHRSFEVDLRLSISKIFIFCCLLMLILWRFPRGRSAYSNLPYFSNLEYFYIFVFLCLLLFGTLNMKRISSTLLIISPFVFVLQLRFRQFWKACFEYLSMVNISFPLTTVFGGKTAVLGLLAISNFLAS